MAIFIFRCTVCDATRSVPSSYVDKKYCSACRDGLWRIVRTIEYDYGCLAIFEEDGL